MGWVTFIQVFFKFVQAIFLFHISRAYWSIKNNSKTLVHLIRPSTKIIEFDHVKFPESISSEDGV